jgi:hypothetical protein
MISTTEDLNADGTIAVVRILGTWPPLLLERRVDRSVNR